MNFELKEYVWTIGAIIYVVGMFPVFYTYVISHDTHFGVLDMIAAAGAFILIAQMFVAAVPKDPTPEQLERAKQDRETVN